MWCEFCSDQRYAFVAREPSADAIRKTMADVVPILPDSHVLQPTGEPQAQWNPRFVAYASTQMLTPEQAIALDADRWPGGKMCGFVSWVRERWQEWDRTNGFKHDHDHFRCNSEHNAFDAWLRGEYTPTSRELQSRTARIVAGMGTP